MLQLHDIFKVFHEGTPDEKVALNHVNLTLEKGDFVTVIGSNGAGKSTMMNMISGSLQPDYGTVTIGKQQVTHWPEHERARLIGRVFQDPMAGTAPSMTIEENMAIAYSRNRRRRLRLGVTKSRRTYFQEQLEILGLHLENRMNTPVGTLSGGERQALSLLMATFTQPDILLLDEHTAALDPARAEAVTQLTEQIVRQSELTTLMVTHNMQQAIQLGNRLIMMDKGEIILDVREEEKKTLTVEKLMDAFASIRGEALVDDATLLSV